MKLSAFISQTFSVEFFSPLIPGGYEGKDSITIAKTELSPYKLIETIDCCLLVQPDSDEVLFIPCSIKTRGDKVTLTFNSSEYPLNGEDILVSLPIIYAARKTDQLSAANLREIAFQSKSIMNLIATKAGNLFDGLDGDINDTEFRDRINRDVMLKYPELIHEIEGIQLKQRQLTIALCLGCRIEVLELTDRIPNSYQLLNELEKELGIVDEDESGEITSVAISEELPELNLDEIAAAIVDESPSEKDTPEGEEVVDEDIIANLDF